MAEESIPEGAIPGGAPRSEALPAEAVVEPNTGRRRPRRAVLRGMLVGAGLTLAGLATWSFLGRGRMAPLLSQDLKTAENRWRQSGPANYEIEVKLDGRRPGVFRVVVENGEPAQVTLDGIAPRRHAWNVWTVPGQFDTLWQELANAESPEKGFGAPPGATVVQRVEFDPVWGFPRRYWRSVLGTALDISWEVTHFEPSNSQ